MTNATTSNECVQPPAGTGSAPGGLLQIPFSDSELIFGLIGAVGTELEKIREVLEDRLKVVGYSVTQIRVTKDVIPEIIQLPGKGDGNEYDRITGLMNAGNEARQKSKDNSILALGVAALI